MFLEELEDLKNRFPGRFQLITVLSREAQDVELFHGRLDRERLEAIFAALVPVDQVDEWYLCGPFGMVTGAEELLRRARRRPRPRAPRDLPRRRRHGAAASSRRRRRSATAEAVVTVNLDGRTTVIPMPSREETILDATLRARPDAPYSCTGGVCGTCRARVVAARCGWTATTPSSPRRSRRASCSPARATP